MADSWDVIVVGVADRTPKGMWRTASAIAERSGLDPNAVQQALGQGPVRVHEGQETAQAARARQALQAVGAIVELRRSGTDPGVPPGGATAVGHAAHQPPPGGDPTAIGHVGHAQQQARGPSERSGDWANALDAATSNLEMSGLSALDGSASDGGTAVPRSSRDAISASDQGEEMDARFGGELAEDQRAVEMVEHDSRDIGSADAAGPDTSGEEALSLDLDAAGLHNAPPAGVGSPSPPAGQVAGGAAAREPGLEPPKRVVSSPAPAPVTRLLGSDPATVGVGAAAIALVLALVPALRGASNAEHDLLLPLEEELDSVVDRPLAVRAGTVRSPHEIVAEIEATYGKIRTRYFFTWIGFAIPIGLVIGFVKRPGG